MTETKKCPKCGGTAYHNKGISNKTGRPYENWKCGGCKDVQWVDTPREVEVQTPTEAQQDKWHKEMQLPITTVEELISRLDSIDAALVGIRTELLDINKKLGI